MRKIVIIEKEKVSSESATWLREGGETSMKTLYLICNLQSGRGLIRQRLADVVDLFTASGYHVTVRPTQQPLDACACAEYACLSGFDLLVCCGGDGTLNEVIQGVLTSGRPLPIGYIPTGSTNDFSKGLCIPSDPLEAVKNILEGEPFACDIGRMNHRYFTYIAAFGAFVEVTYETPQPIKNRLGHAAYLLNGLNYLNTLRGYRMRIEHDGGTLEGEYLLGMVSNTASVAGMLKLSDFQLDDGVFEVTLIQKPSNVLQLHQIADSLLHLGTKVDERYVQYFRSSFVRLTAEQDTPWTLDGERGDNRRETLIENCRTALQFITRFHG